MDGDDAPGALDAELLKEGRRHDGLVGDEGVRVEEGSTQDRCDDDAEATAEDLGRIANAGATGDGTEVGDDLGDRLSVSGKAELAGQHRGVEVLRTMGHKIKASHQEHEVDEQEPVSLQSDFPFHDEGPAFAAVGIADFCTFNVRLGFREHKAEGDDQNWWTGAEPVEWTPGVAGSVH